MAEHGGARHLDRMAKLQERYRTALMTNVTIKALIEDQRCLTSHSEYSQVTGLEILILDQHFFPWELFVNVASHSRDGSRGPPLWSKLILKGALEKNISKSDIRPKTFQNVSKNALWLTFAGGLCRSAFPLNLFPSQSAVAPPVKCS